MRNTLIVQANVDKVVKQYKSGISFLQISESLVEIANPEKKKCRICNSGTTGQLVCLLLKIFSYIAYIFASTDVYYLHLHILFSNSYADIIANT